MPHCVQDAISGEVSGAELANIEQQNRAATPQEAARLAELERLAQGGYAAIWQDVIKGRK